ncbi:MAG: phenylalanine--tRNA ligase subunit beta [Alphaproteobacteria bacterium]|nr:phenylalanine--tRNA ligase subunit beta [Alphaproteobacteria bacterium]
MKFTISWLKEYLETSASNQEIIEQLSMLGLVVDDVIDRSLGLQDFKIVHVTEVSPHPEAERLSVCQVYTGQETLQIVCGGINVKKHMKAVLAPIGSTIPENGLKIKLGKIRGIDSHGMLCSSVELGLDEPYVEKSIMDLPEDAPVGMVYSEYAGLDDLILDIEVTPNRGDCFGIYGIARDLAATGLGTLKPIHCPEVSVSTTSPISVEISDDAADACTYFTSTYIQGVENKPSPAWMQKKLLSVGLKPISALVDITNYISQAYGRPMHVFDADCLKGQLNVRQAKAGEKVLALNGKEYELDPSITIVADDVQPHAVAGIIGGMDSGCTETTKNVLVECAVFDPICIALTGRKLNVITDARQRLERGVDREIIETAQKMATDFILTHCGGKASGITTTGKPAPIAPAIPLRMEKIEKLLGFSIPEEKCKSILEALGMTVQKNGENWAVQAPSWRHDIIIEADLIEEIIRVYGYNHIPTQYLPSTQTNSNFESYPGSRTYQKWGWQVRRALCSRGLSEAMSLSFLDEKTARLFGGGQDSLKLINPISQDLSHMRPSLLPNLIQAVQRNCDRGRQNVSLFEVGKQFSGITKQDESMVACGVRSGKTAHKHWAETIRDVDIFDVKADALTAMQACNFDTKNLQVIMPGPDYYHPGRSGYFTLGPKNKIAAFGEIHPKILAEMKIDSKVVGFEVYMEKIPISNTDKKAVLELSPYQAVERDFAFIMDKAVKAQDLLAAVKRADKDLITDIRLFDVYEGKNVASGKKSIAVSIRLEPRQATLTEEQLTEISTKIIENVKTLTGGELRS